MTKKNDQTYDFICFTDLIYEFDISKKKEIEKKIKSRLKYHKLGDYDQDKVDYIRALKNDLRSDIAKTSESTYFHKSKSEYAELTDFDVDSMTTDYHKKYNKVNKDELKAMINFAIYSYHLR